MPSSADLDRIQHGYDRASNRIWRKNPVAAAAGVYLDEFYAYNGMYELARLDRGQLNASNTGIASGTLDYAQAWGLDATGNWQAHREDSTGAGSWSLTQSRTANKFNEITSISGGPWAQPTYDLAGNMTAMPQPASPTSSYTGVYDAWNRLVSLWFGGTTAGQYSYDGKNRRTTKLVAGTTRHYYYSAAWQEFEERLGASTTPDRQFVCGLRYIDDLILRDRGSERLYCVQDPNWNVTAIIDASGTVGERYAYSAYGRVRFMGANFGIEGASLYNWERLFAGYLSDAETLLLHARRRTLHSVVGSWLTRDPYRIQAAMRSTSFVVSQHNLYIYAHNSAASFTDPSGLEEAPCSCTLKGLSVVSSKCKFSRKNRLSYGQELDIQADFGPTCCCCEYRQYVVSNDTWVRVGPSSRGPWSPVIQVRLIGGEASNSR